MLRRSIGPPEREESEQNADDNREMWAIAKQILAAEWMSETESGPEDLEERRAWLKKLGKAKDAKGKRTTCYNVKGKGVTLYEVLGVPWRSEVVSTLVHIELRIVKS